MTGITPGIAAAREAQKEFNEMTRNMQPELVVRIQANRLTEEDLASALVQRAAEAWGRCSVQLNDGMKPEAWQERMA